MASHHLPSSALVRRSLLALAAAAGCAAPPAGMAPEPTGGCRIGSAVAGARAPGAPVVIGLSSPVDPAHAPIPTNDAERLVFAQLYETLVRVDCEGRVVPGLAASWAAEPGGRSWTFGIDPDARDWRGAAVTAEAVAESWVAAENAPAEGPAGAAGWTGAAGVTGPAGPAGAPRPSRFRALEVLDRWTLRVELRDSAVAAFFARPELAVRTLPGDGSWPIGTGAFRPADASVDRPGLASPGAPIRLSGPVAIELHDAGPDARDALDRGADLLVTRDPAAIDYARARPGFDATPLPWDRTHMLVVPGGSAGDPPPEALEALARDAVRADARGAERCPTRFPGDVSRSGDARPPAAAPNRPPRIVFLAGDPVARALAERLVALAGAGPRAGGGWILELVPSLAGAGRPAAVGMDGAALADAIRRGADAAYVISAAHGPEGDACAALSLAGAVFPLVQTRATLVLRRGMGAVEVDAGGTLRLERLAGATAEGGR